LRTVAFGLSLILLIVSWAGGATLLEEAVFEDPNFAKALVITVLALPFLTDMTVLGGAFRGFYRPFPSIVAQNLVQPLVRILTIIGLLAIGQDFLALPLGVVISALFSWAILQFQASGFLGTSRKVLATPLTEIKHVLSYSTPLSLALMVAMLTRMLDLLMVGYFRAPSELGQYSVILLMTQLIGLAPAALSQTLGTRVAAAHVQADIAKIKKIQVDYTMQVALVAAPLFACILFWGDRIDLLIGDSYRLDWRVICTAASTAALGGLMNGLGHMLGMTGHQRRELGIIAAGFALQAVMGWILIPRMGQTGAAITSFVTVVFIWLARLWTIHLQFGITPVAVSAFLPFGAASLLAFGVYQATSQLDRAIVPTAISCLAVVGAYWLSVLTIKGVLGNARFLSN
jgi:O-antigen/teichoic acid export membrane protein